MATRSTLAVVHNDGSVSQSYCHYDGYLEYNGNVLTKFYDTLDKVEELISFGDASGLGSSVGERHDFNERATYVNDVSTSCTFYGRDRGESCTSARKFASIEEYEKRGDSGMFEEYNYLFLEGRWYYKCGSGEVRDVLETLNEMNKVETV